MRRDIIYNTLCYWFGLCSNKYVPAVLWVPFDTTAYTCNEMQRFIQLLITSSTFRRFQWRKCFRCSETGNCGRKLYFFYWMPQFLLNSWRTLSRMFHLKAMLLYTSGLIEISKSSYNINENRSLLRQNDTHDHIKKFALVKYIFWQNDTRSSGRLYTL